MHTFTTLFLAALGINTLIQWWLLHRQIDHVRACRHAVPDAFSERVSLEAHQKAADYTVTRARFEQFELLSGMALLLLWTLGGGLNMLDSACRSLGLSPLFTGTIFILSAFAILAVIELPFSVYRTFVIEQRFGFNRTTPKLFLTDFLKEGVLGLCIGGPLVMLILWLMAHAGTLWWAAVWIAWFGFSLLMIWIYPAFIAPLFNQFRPMEDDRLRQRIESLLARNGFSSQGIFVMDGSKRSAHGNAYFTGLGNNKRIVFFDTLMGELEAEELESVLAHELGHFKCRHVVKRMILMAGMSFLGLALLGWLIGHEWFFQGLGVSQPSMHAALILFLMAIPVFMFPFQPVLAALSRKHEFEADDYASAQADAGTLIRALVKLYKENASTLTPDPLYSAFHDSHPPAPVRVAHLASKVRETSKSNVFGI
jgi:STE24 endopeptidase